ncbi:peptide chain release factor N(5)-glutamine methyltransferase [Thiorhodospira sibirica]|uniref:peptide chain release factor N(5)-glutamine methyltransferase n=1 Tax=Thiorhodospira sibirica TaxID=154347 RepID=UPI001FE43A67|nr:peptide chain release factor N(5)-glutamine methyltransferase [Thiorhodospira sibirica]
MIYPALEPMQAAPLSIHTWLQQASHALRVRQYPSQEARLLLQTVLQCTPTWLLSHDEAPLQRHQVQRATRLLQRRLYGEPIAYLLGEREFWSLPLEVSLDTLIPRPETEHLVEAALGCMRARPCVRALDLGTGTGAVAIALAHEHPGLTAVAVEKNPATAAVAARNIARHQLTARVRLQIGDWFAPVAGEQFDVIVANPPYIARDDVHLKQGDVRFEPMMALVSGNDGLDALRHIIAHAPEYLCPAAYLWVEHGHTQAAAVRALLSEAGFAQCQTQRDLAGHERVSGGRWC